MAVEEAGATAAAGQAGWVYGAIACYISEFHLFLRRSKGAYSFSQSICREIRNSTFVTSWLSSSWIEIGCIGFHKTRHNCL